MIQSFSLPQEHETAAGSSSRDHRQHPSSVIFCSRVRWNAQSTRECFCYRDWGGNRDDHSSTCWVGARLLLFGLGAVKPQPTGSPRICIRRRLRKTLMTLVQVPFSFGSFTPKPFQFVLFIFVCFDRETTLYIRSFNPSLSCSCW